MANNVPAVVPPISDPGVASRFASYPDRIRTTMLALRRLIFEIAAATDGVGPLLETLRWGEPAYLTSKTGSGSTSRIDWKARSPDDIAMYFVCTTDLVTRFRTRYKKQLRFEGNRAILLPVDSPIPRGAIGACIKAALTYHAVKKKTVRRNT